MSILRHRSVVCLALVASLSWAQAPAQSARKGTIQAEAWQIVVLANQARAEAGAAPLEWDPALAAAARQHCLRMAAEGPISHRYGGELDVGGRAAQAGAHFSLIEENVAIGPTPAEIHNEWMNSSGHRTNLLNPNVDRVGVAVVASRGVLYAVADYDRIVPVLTQRQIEAAIAGLLRDRGITQFGDPTDARASCVEESEVHAGRRPGFLMLWVGADVAHLPDALVDRIASGKYHEAAVGSCPLQATEGSFSAYRVAVLLY
jgi:Cysteine-rich secretory protein family